MGCKGGRESDRRKVIVLFLLQHAVGECHPGGDDFYDVPFDDPFGMFGVFELLANGDTVPRLEKLGQVRVECVMGESGKRDFPGSAVAALCQCDSQNARGGGCVFFKRLEEIAHPEEENRVRVARLDAGILLHEGC